MIDSASEFSKEVEILAQTFQIYIGYGVQMQLMYLAVMGVLFKFSLDALNSRKNNLFTFLAVLIFAFAIWILIILIFHERVVDKLLRSFEQIHEKDEGLVVTVNQYIHDVGYFQHYLWAIITFHILLTISAAIFLIWRRKFHPNK